MYTFRGHHTFENIKRGSTDLVPSQSDVELLASHFSKVILDIFDSTLAKQMQKGVTIMIREQGVATNLNQIFKRLPVKFGASDMQRCDAVNVASIWIRVTVFKHRLNNILVSANNSLVQWHFTSGIDTWLSLLEDIAQN
jgi:hypothetical protein